jgi:glycine/D-amino acid oxidase-like deaminating enzyme
MSPDQNFILDRHPRSPRVLACCGLSGHGFKLVPALGEVLAGLALDDRLPPEATFLGVSRFAKSS